MPIVTDVAFDDEKYYLGQLCPSDHDYCGQKQSLRFKSDRSCLYCKREAAERRRKRKQALARKADLLIPTNIVDAIELNEDLHCLGLLCVKRHDHNGTRQSLRFKSNEHCVYCNREKGVKYRLEHRNEINAQKRANYVPGSMNDYAREYYQKNKERIRVLRQTPEYREKEKLYRQTVRNPERKKLLAKLSRKRREARERFAYREHYSNQDVLARFESFQNRCAYCNRFCPNPTHDHVVPFARQAGSGTDRILNLVPACESCNYSKHNLPLILWYVRKVRIFDITRLNKILSLLGDKEYDMVIQDYFQYRDKILEYCKEFNV
jgi:hypothetical protein